MSIPRSRSQSPVVDVESELDRLPSSPTPPLRAVCEECHKSTNAIFIKRWYRGSNTCSRCDFEFTPLAGSRLALKRSEHSIKSTQGPRETTRPAAATVKSSNDKRSIDVKKEEKLSPVLKKRSPPEVPGGDAQVTSSLLGGGQALLGYGANQFVPPFLPDSPAWRAYMSMHDPTPALRQLSEYAKPHLGGKQDLLHLSSENPIANLHTSRERFEELDRRKHFIRDEAKLGSCWPLSSTPPAARVTAPPYGSPFELQLAELQRLYSAAAAGSLGPFPPSWCHPQNIAAEFLQRERLVQLASINSALLAGDPAVTARVTHTDRPSMLSDSLLRLQAAASSLGMGGANSSFAVDNSLAAPGSATGELSHTHTHSHTHLHLHQPDPSTASATSNLPPLHPLLTAAASPFVPSHGFNLPVSPAITSAQYMQPTAAAYGLAAGPQLVAAAREQEMMYREVLSRMQYNSDPVLAQHLLVAQATAHQEAIQRMNLARLHGNPLPR